MITRSQSVPAFAALRRGLRPGFGVLAVVLAMGRASAETTVLTNAITVRALSAERAALHLPVRLRGVFMGQTGSLDQGFVISDDGEGVYVEGAVSNIVRGDIIEVTGVTDPGGFAPFVQARTVRKVGEGQIPAPLNVGLGELSNGGLDAQWVEVSGIVRSCEPMPASERPVPPPGTIVQSKAIDSWSKRKFKMTLASGDERVAVQVNDELKPEIYIDAEVRVRGICFSQHNTTRQFLNPLLLVPNGVEVVVEKRPQPDAFSIPARAVASLMEFNRQANFGHRVHVRGVVTYHRPGEFLWLRDHDRGLRAESRQAELLQPGDEVDVAGFPGRGQYTPVLEDAVFRKILPGPLPAAFPLRSLLEAFRHDADLVEVQGTLLEWRQNGDGYIVELDWDGQRTEALLRSQTEPGLTDKWLPNSHVSVSGICSVMTSKNGPVSGIWEPATVQLLLRTPQDLTVVRAPPWWTYQHILIVLSLAVAASLIAVATVMWLARQRLRDQEDRRARAESEFAAILSERNRMAREIHDTLAQGLVATSVQLRLAKKQIGHGGALVAQHLDTAQQLVRESLEEARNSIWNMRPHVLETRDLAGALEGILRQLSEGTGVEANIRVAGKARRLAPMIENNLLRVGQEAITNATRHAHAKRITVMLDFAEKQFCLRVRDDGQGFDAAQPPPGGGGFGLVGIRERATQLKGELNIQSAPGTGTEVGLTVPLSD
ncbi:MAG TPA: sensor histidine kinase [Verrucomicrobiae bacterium]|nr:sensor histidine kinase [Verrucomicrobiae bacterium]